MTGCASERVAPRDQTHEFRQFTIGLCEDYPEESRSLEAARKDLQLLATNNIRVLRIAFGWDAMEPERGQYDFSFWDEFVRIAVDDFEIRLIPYVCYTPKWASRSSGEDSWRQPPKDNADFANFMRRVVNRYKNRIHSWELWNEPDNRAYWEGTTAEFAALLKAGSRAVREADPNATVVSGGIAWDLNFLKELFEQHAVSPHLDIVNIHNYYETWGEEPIEEISGYIKRAATLVEKYGNGQPLWLAEAGYSDFRKGAYVSEVYQARTRYEHTPEFQALSLGRMVATVAATERIPLLAWYRIHDLPEDEEVIGDVNNRHLGVLDKNGNPKRALKALRFFRELLGREKIKCLDRESRLERTIDSLSEVHVFETQSGKIIIIAWLQLPPARLVSRTHLAENVTLALPFSLRNESSIYNESGERIGGMTSKGKARSSSLETLRLRENELKVIVAERADVSRRKTGNDVLSLAE